MALFDVDPSGQPRYVTGGSTTVRDNLVPGTHELIVPLGTYAYVPREGHRLRVQIENLAWHRPPISSNESVLLGLPVFGDFEFLVERSGALASRVELPILPFADPTLVAGAARIDGAAPVDFELALHSDSSRSGWSYQILAGVSGAEPPTPYQGLLIPIAYDSVTEQVLNDPGSLPISGFQGTLDSDGRASAQVLLSGLPFLPPEVGELNFAAVITSPGGAVQVTNPARVAVF